MFQPPQVCRHRDAVTRDDLFSFHKKYFAPNNAILAVVGDVTAEEAFTEARRVFGGWVWLVSLMAAIAAGTSVETLAASEDTADEMSAPTARRRRTVVARIEPQWYSEKKRAPWGAPLPDDERRA